MGALPSCMFVYQSRRDSFLFFRHFMNLCSLGWSRIYFVYQVGLELTGTHLPLHLPLQNS